MDSMEALRERDRTRGENRKIAGAMGVYAAQAQQILEDISPRRESREYMPFQGSAEFKKTPEAQKKSTQNGKRKKCANKKKRGF